MRSSERAYRFNFGILIKHDLVLVVQVRELLLRDVDPSFRDSIDFAFFENWIEFVDSLVESSRTNLTLKKSQTAVSSLSSSYVDTRRERTYRFIEQVDAEKLSISTLIRVMPDF